MKAAGGVISEKRFSGQDDLTPNNEQLLWHFYNIIWDNQGTIDIEDVNDFSDYQLYELSKRMSLDDLSKKFYNASKDHLTERIQKFIATLSVLQALHPNMIPKFTAETA